MSTGDRHVDGTSISSRCLSSLVGHRFFLDVLSPVINSPSKRQFSTSSRKKRQGSLPRIRNGRSADLLKCSTSPGRSIARPFCFIPLRTKVGLKTCFHILGRLSGFSIKDRFVTLFHMLSIIYPIQGRVFFSNISFALHISIL